MIRKLCIILGVSVAASFAQEKVIAHWTFDSLTGKTFNDVSGNGYDAVVSGDSIGTADGISGKALWCKGKGFDITVNNSYPAFALNKFSVEAWVNSSIDLVNVGSFFNYKSIFDNSFTGMEGSGVRGGYALEITDQGIPYLGASNPGGDDWINVYSDSTIWPNRWYHLVSTYDGSLQKIYINGVLKGATIFAGGFKPNPNPAHIACQYQLSDATGKSGHQRNWFVGKIDELTLYNYALDSQTVAVHYDSLKPKTQKPFKIGLGMTHAYCKPGDTITMPLMITNYENISISAIQFALKIDPTKVKLLNISKDSGIVKDWLMTWNKNSIDSIPVAMGGTNTILGYGDGELLRCTFIVNNSMSNSDSAQICFSAIMVDELNSDLITVWSTPGMIYTSDPGILYGDVNGNNVVNVFDAQEILAYSVGMFTLPDQHGHPNFTIKVADVSGNGTVTSYDAALVFQYSVGLISEFPVQRKTLAKKIALLSSSSETRSPAELSIANVSTTADSMKFNLIGNNLSGLIAGDFVIEYDPVLMRAIMLSQIHSGVQNFKIIAYSDTSSYCYKIGITANDAIATNDQLVFATISLPASTGANPLTLLRIKQASLNEGKIPTNIVTTKSIRNVHDNSLGLGNGTEQPHIVNHMLILPRADNKNELVRLISLNGKFVLQNPISINSQTRIDINGRFKGTYIYSIVKNGISVRSGMLLFE